jgi:hypothetical protein
MVLVQRDRGVDAPWQLSLTWFWTLCLPLSWFPPTPTLQIHVQGREVSLAACCVSVNVAVLQTHSVAQRGHRVDDLEASLERVGGGSC